jgi:acetoin utilization protein AcuB
MSRGDRMTVSQWMTKRLVTVGADAPVAEAWRRMQRRRIRHVPVWDRGKLVGIISDRDVRLAFPAPAADMEVGERRALWERLRVWQIMSRVLVTVAPDTPMERAARTLLRYRISGLPVLSDGRLVGIITETDFLRGFIALRKAHPPRTRPPRAR